MSFFSKTCFNVFNVILTFIAFMALSTMSCFFLSLHQSNIKLHVRVVQTVIVCAGFVAKDVTIDIAIPTQADPVPVMSVFGWIIIHQHPGYTFNWNLPWADYKAGFGSIEADFWLGLERMHLLTSSQAYRLRVEVQQRSTNLWYSAEYWSFETLISTGLSLDLNTRQN